MISISTDQPFADAVKLLTEKIPVGSRRSSAEWEMLPADFKARSMFSARVEKEFILTAMQERLKVRIALAKKDGRTMDRGVFIEEMRDELTKSGYKRGEAPRGSLQDLKSTRRLGLIFDMNIAQAQGYAKYLLAMTPEGLENEPAWELVRIMGRVEARDWPVIWQQNGGTFYDGPGSNDDYPLAPGRMIAKKTDPIWTNISRFQTPWAPLDWGSGMGMRGMGREESDAYGVTSPTETLTPNRQPFNEGLSASMEGIPEAGRQRIIEDIAGEVDIIEQRLVMRPAPVVPPGPLTQVISSALSGIAVTAVAILSKIGAPELEKLTAALKNTVAWTRFSAALKANGEEPLEKEAQVRAIAQFIATAEGKKAIRAIRETPLRDTFWSPMDFLTVEGLLKQLIPGGVA
jgi:hypothetical protein